jgi:hypothetical protein
MAHRTYMTHVTYALGSMLSRVNQGFAAFDICFTLAGE